MLRYFLAVAREGTVTKAAESLFLTQPTLSRQLSDLEYELGASLFIRGKKRIELTEAGMILKQRAEEILELQEKTVSEIQNRGKNLRGTVSVGAAETSAAEILPSLILNFQKKYPEVRFEIQSGVASFVKDKVDQGLLDLGLVLEPGNIDNYRFLRLGIEDRCGILMNVRSPLAQKASVTVADLIGRPVIANQRKEIRDFYRRRLGEDFDRLNIIAKFNLVNNAAFFAGQDDVYIFVIEGCVKNFDKTVFCFRPFEPEIRQDSFLIWKKQEPQNRCLARFLEEIKNTFQA